MADDSLAEPAGAVGARVMPAQQPLAVWLRIAAWGAVLVGVLPLIVGRPAPFRDWPSHLGRVEILVDLLRGHAFWQPYYRVGSFLLPNMILDAGVGGLHLAGLSLDAAAAIFLVALYALFVAGFCIWSAAATAGRIDTLRALVAAILFYNGALASGLVNYLFGLALAFLFAAFWLRASPNGSRRAAIAMCGVVVLFFCHIFAAATFLVLIGSFEIGPLLTGRHGSFGALLRGSSSILAGMLAVLLFLISALSTPLVAAPESTAAVYPASVGGFALEKLKLLIKPVLDGNGLAAIATVLGFAGVLLLAWRSRIRWSGPVLLIIAVMGVVAMVTPISLFADGKLDYRFALVPIFAGLAGLQITWRSDRLRQLAVLLLTVTVLARTVLLTVAYAEDNKVYRALEDATKALPPGSILLTGFGLKEDQLSWWDIWAPPATHLATRAVVEGVLVPDVFAVPAQQPLAWLGVRGPDTANPFDTITKESFYIGDKSSLQSVMTGLSGACRDLVQGPVPHHLFLLVLYPSAVTQANLQPQSIVASNPKFQLVDLCRWQH